MCLSYSQIALGRFCIRCLQGASQSQNPLEPWKDKRLKKFTSFSSLVGVSLGMGQISAAFQTAGTTPKDRERLNISVTGSANSYANCFSTRGGMLSGPVALNGLSFRSFLQTWQGSINGTCSADGKKVGNLFINTGGSWFSGYTIYSSILRVGPKALMLMRIYRALTR